MTIPADQLVFVAERIVAVGCLDLLSDMTLADRRALIDELRENLKRPGQ